MFDPRTAELIQSVPKLPGLDGARLPDELTKAFAAIVAFRVRLGQVGGQLPEELQEQLDTFRRLAATFETMVALLPDRPDRSASAFVAAQAYQLLHLARRATTSPDATRPSPLRREAISPEVSALVLFLIANQPSDATEMARALTEVRPDGNGVSGLLVDALVALAHGHLARIVTLASQVSAQLPDDLQDAAVEALYRRLLQGLARIADHWLGSPASTADEDGFGILREVQSLAVEQRSWPILPGEQDHPPPSISAFAGPHQLATLLISASDILSHAALAALPPPTGVTPSSWREHTLTIRAERPFLWPNHLEAINQGFLESGVSAVVSFPTGAGKSTLSELKAASALALGGAVVYLAPTHALVNQVKASLTKAFPAVEVRDSLLVDDFYAEVGESFASSNPQIVVMTPERCLALLAADSLPFVNVTLVIFDECHLLHPKGTGHNRRSLDAMLAVLHLQRAAPFADWLLLSAMMSNADEIASWLKELLGRSCLALNLNWKPTRQARGCLVYEQSEIDALNGEIERRRAAHTNPDGTMKAPGKAVQATMQAHPYGFFCLKQTWNTKDVQDYTLLRLLDQSVPLSVTRSPDKRRWYLTPNKNEVAARLAAQCVRLGMKVLLFGQDTRFVSSIAKRIDTLMGEGAMCQFTPDEQLLMLQAQEEAGSGMALLVSNARAASHHGLMLRAERELVESLFRRSDGINALSATPTLAQGMNLPADVVFIVGDERFDAESQQSAPLAAHELLNAAGRAGRAGMVAQGLVVVLPHQLVSLDAQTHTIGTKWMQLRDSVFSKADQCLQILDPISDLLDRIQDSSAATEPEMRYFLRRLPLGGTADPEATQRFLRSTLAAFHAKRQNKEAQFESRVASAVARRKELVPQKATDTWLDELAYQTGVAVEIIGELSQEMVRLSDKLPADTENLVHWFFGWLVRHPSRLKGMLAHRIPKQLLDGMEQGDLFGGRFVETIWAWMSGETLLQLNVRVGTHPTENNSGPCIEARKFVLRLVPDLAYASGLATKIRRKHIESDDAIEMPVALATLALCVREGRCSPEVAALGLSPGFGSCSRQALRRHWAEMESVVEPGDPLETFFQTRKRIRNGIASFYGHR